jgi:hypothetical protein
MWKGSIWNAIDQEAQKFFPGHFAWVMAMGIVSIAVDLLQISLPIWQRPQRSLSCLQSHIIPLILP